MKATDEVQSQNAPGSQSTMVVAQLKSNYTNRVSEDILVPLGVRLDFSYPVVTNIVIIIGIIVENNFT